MLEVSLNRLADIAFTPAENIDDHESINLADQTNSASEPKGKVNGKIEVKNLCFKMERKNSLSFNIFILLLNLASQSPLLVRVAAENQH